MKQTQTPERIGIGEMLSFFLANVGNIPLMTLTSSYLMIFYTNVVGLNPAACATLLLVSRILDGVNDPIMGFLLDRLPQGKMGKFRPMLIFGTVICCVNYVLLWFGPVWAPSGKLVIACATYLLLGITFDLMDISLNSLLPLMTDDSRQRNRLSTVKSVGYTVGSSLRAVLTPLILGDTSNLHGYYVLILGTVVVVMALSILGALGVKERVVPIHCRTYSPKTQLRILREKPVLVTALVMLLYSIGTSMITASNTYFYTYVIADLNKLSVVSLVIALANIPSILLIEPILGRFGKKACYVWSMVLPVPFLLARLFHIRNFAVILVAAAVSGFAGGLCGPVRHSIQADNSDYIILKHRHHTEAAIASLSSFIVKCAIGIGGAIPGYLLACAGFNRDAAVQPAAVTTVIVVCAVVLPALLSLISAALFGRLYPLNQTRLAEQNEALRQLRRSDFEQKGGRPA